MFKGTTLLPLLQSRNKFEQLLQEMLRREVGEQGQKAGEGLFTGVSCRWCSQVFPSEATLAHHKLYQCRCKDAAGSPQSHRHKAESPLNFSRPSNVPYDTQTSPTNTVPYRDLSSPQRAWHSVPQQILVPLPTPIQLSQDSPKHKHWPNEENSPRKSVDPSSPSGSERHQTITSRFGSPRCMDLFVNSTSPHQPRHRLLGLEVVQSEPLDLSIPKAHSLPRESKNLTCNGFSPHREGRDNGNMFMPQQVGGAYAVSPLFGNTVFSNYPLFNHIIPGSLAGMGHNGLTSLPLTTPATSPGFISPVAFMPEAESESWMKRIQHERHSMMVRQKNK